MISMRVLGLLALSLLGLNCQQPRPAATVENRSPAGPPAGIDQTIYETRRDHDPSGTGKFYLGREIAQVMGYQGAGWLERPERIEEERPDEVVARIRLRPTDVVADVGAGTGYFSFRFARVVTEGTVLAVDLQPEMLAILERRKAELKIANLRTVQSTPREVNLPENSVDVVFFADVYHEFEWPREMMQSIVRALRPGGRVVQIEYRGEDPEVPIKKVHKMTVAQCRKEMAAVGLVWKETQDFLPWQHFIVFEKPAR